MEIQRLQHLGTWTTTTLMKIGRNLANNSKVDPLFEDLLTKQLPPITPAVLGEVPGMVGHHWWRVDGTWFQAAFSLRCHGFGTGLTTT